MSTGAYWLQTKHEREAAMFTLDNGRHGSPLVSSQRTSVDWNEVSGPILGHQEPGRCATDAIRDCGGGHQSRARDHRRRHPTNMWLQIGTFVPACKRPSFSAAGTSNVRSQDRGGQCRWREGCGRLREPQEQHRAREHTLRPLHCNQRGNLNANGMRP